MDGNWLPGHKNAMLAASFAIMAICTLSTSGFRRALVAAVMVLVPQYGLTAPARAAEQIVLPFDCDVVGGRVQVRPSGDQAYRIYGSRKQEQYRACSDQNPDRCRTFLVQSFKMACGRDRVEWPDVYAAIAKVTDGRAFYNADGALYYRMGPRETQDSYPFPEARRATGIVEMPPGFAPMAGVDAIFTPLDPRVAELEAGPPPDPRGSREPAPSIPADNPSFAPALTPKPVETPKLAEAPKAATTPKPADPPKAAEPPKSEVVLEPKPPEPKPETPALETASTKPPPAEPVDAPKAEATPTDAVGGGTPVTPTILNNPAAKEVETASKTETVVAAAEVAPPPQPAATPDTGSRVEGWSGTGGSGIAFPPIALAIGIAAATLAALLMILKKQASAPIAAGPVRVPIEPTLPGFEWQKAGSTAQAMTVRENPDPPALSSAAAGPAGIPTTREDALALLGLSSGATDAAIRKIVEALRQSWHPDLASDETERAAREERIKAINVAAGILLRKSAA